MSPDAQHAVQTFVASQKTAHGYMNAGGREDAYYEQFGVVLEAVFSPVKLVRLPRKPLMVPESMGQDTIYGQFFAFLEQETKFTLHSSDLKHQTSYTPLLRKRLLTPLGADLTTNAMCCVLTMQHQMDLQPDRASVERLRRRQDENGGFHASEQAPIPDLLSTAVSLFTLRLIGESARDATPFVQAHWMEGGGFAPTLFDDYSDVEYVFYGLLALGTS